MRHVISRRDKGRVSLSGSQMSAWVPRYPSKSADISEGHIFEGSRNFQTLLTFGGPTSSTAASPAERRRARNVVLHVSFTVRRGAVPFIIRPTATNHRVQAHAVRERPPAPAKHSNLLT